MDGRAKIIVVDASVVLSWILPDEKVTPQANKLHQRSISGKIVLLAPKILFYEVLNGLRSAVVQKRLDHKLLTSAIKQFFNVNLKLQEQKDQAQQIASLSLNQNLSIYDAAYVALARKLKATLYTGDKKLSKKITGAKVSLLG